jgi:hypothetical protein
MNLDAPEALEVLRNERVLINGRQAPVYAHVTSAGDPVSGGALEARQSGDQFTLRFLKTEYPDPQVHDKLKTDNFGTLRMKQRFLEGDFWSCLCTGSVRGGRDR